MKEFDHLLEITDTLLGPEGCPWDRKQTMKSVRKHVLEEVSELIDAIDMNDNKEIEEELGDLFFNVVFFARLAEKENRFKIEDTLNHISEKLIRRHPHVFETKKEITIDELHSQWNQIKSEEKKERKSPLDGIPKSLPALARAQKMLPHIDHPEPDTAIYTEETLGQELLKLVAAAKRDDLDAELALRKSFPKS